MGTIAKSDNARPDAEAILANGSYYILDRCASHEEVYPTVCEAFYAGVAALAGKSAEAAVRRDGLAMLHKHFPTEKVLLLEEHVRLALRETLYYWSYRVGKEDLKLVHPFYVDHLIVVRIHYPYEVAKRAKKAEYPKTSRADLVDHAAAALRNPQIIVNQISRAIRRKRDNSAYDPDQFHGALTKPARAHGAHIDTWYGHSFDGINLWWSIDGVTVDNTVILYPDMFARPMEYDKKSMYLASGQQVSEPHQVDLAPGQLLLFNPEMLHSTQVNISDKTRVALTTRINPHKPQFNDEAPFNFEHWHNSKDLEKRRFQSLDVYPAGRHRGAPSYEMRAKLEPVRTRKIVVDRGFSDGAACDSSSLVFGAKLAIDFTDAKVILWRTADGEARAFLRNCPHVGVDLADGWHDDEVVHCPGHGLRFSWRDGRSNCASFRLKPFAVEERDGKIFLHHGAKRETADAACAVA